MQYLERRVDLLEKANRRYRYLFFLLLAGLVAACGIQMRGADVLKAKAIEVVSDDGKVLFRVDSAGSGGRLRLFNVWGNTSFEVFNLGSGAEVIVRNEDGRELVNLIPGGTAVGGKTFVTAQVPLEIAYPSLETQVRKAPIAKTPWHKPEVPKSLLLDGR